MNREQKALVIQTLKDNFLNSKASFLVDYRGLKVNEMQKLRNQLREKSGKLKVAKARLMKRAVAGVEGIDQLADFFKDQVGLVFASNEPPVIAKVLHEFSKDNESLTLVVGYFDKQILKPEQIIRIASLPSRAVLLAQMAGTLKAPIARLVSLMNLMTTRLVWTLKQVGEKKK